MKEHPILFSTDMVKAILNGRKTQTRHLAKAPLHLLSKEPECFKPPYATGDLLWVRETWCESPKGYLYKASSKQTKIRWRPSIHMPREACRILLEIDGLRLERLQEIADEDAREEGVKPVYIAGEAPYRAAFHALWIDMYRLREMCWEANPWVWAIRFRVLEMKT